MRSDRALSRRALCRQILAALCAIGGAPGGRAANGADGPATTLEAAARPLDADVIVVGSGLAGLSAAIAAREAGAARVIILEKLPIAGGHGRVSSGSFAAAIPEGFEAPSRDPRRFRAPVSASEKRPDDAAVESFYRDILAAGGETVRPVLAHKLARESWDAVLWLGALGVRWERRVFQAVGSPARRNIATGSPQSGLDYVSALLARTRALGIEIRFETAATALLCEPREDLAGRVRITGVRCRPRPIFEANPAPGSRTSAPSAEADGDGAAEADENADEPAAFDLHSGAVVLATGGFAANAGMRRRFAPELPARFPTTANPRGNLLDGATGDGIRMAEAVGARLIGMRDIQIMPYSGGRLLNYVGGEIWLNAQGKRFVRSGLLFRELREAILRQPEGIMWALSDSATQKGATLGAKLDQGIVRRADSLEEAAAGMGIPFPVLRETVAQWNRAVDTGWDEAFGVPMTGTRIETPPFYYGLEHFSVHYTCGGIEINASAAALDLTGAVIAGLFAAGETTGGIHGHERIGGAAVTDCIVFGRTAGQSAARFAACAAASAESSGEPALP